LCFWLRSCGKGPGGCFSVALWLGLLLVAAGIKGRKAHQAAGVIHTDFEKGCINLGVASFKDLDTSDSTAGAKAAGKVRMEGRDYVIQDGEVIDFRFND
jgi:ribosome-binding ATPase YchF (GTP1/OBG family)